VKRASVPRGIFWEVVMIRTHQRVKAPRLRVLAGGGRSWRQRFWDVEELFELKLTMLVLVMLMGAALGA
jgi:hypothetical protein